MNNKNKISYISLLLAMVGYWKCSHTDLINKIQTDLFHMGVLELYPLDQVSSNCALRVHQIEAFYFKMFKRIPPDPPGGCDVHPPINTCSYNTEYI